MISHIADLLKPINRSCLQLPSVTWVSRVGFQTGRVDPTCLEPYVACMLENLRASRARGAYIPRMNQICRSNNKDVYFMKKFTKSVLIEYLHITHCSAVGACFCVIVGTYKERDIRNDTIT
jgi:hypothetical protein